MAEYIERDAAIKAFCEQCQDYIDNKCTYEGFCEVSFIETVPAADVQPVKRGKWLHDRKNQWKCSKCGNFLDFDGLNCGRGSAFYCPNCGADMRGDIT